MLRNFQDSLIMSKFAFVSLLHLSCPFLQLISHSNSAPFTSLHSYSCRLNRGRWIICKKSFWRAFHRVQFLLLIYTACKESTSPGYMLAESIPGLLFKRLHIRPLSIQHWRLALTDDQSSSTVFSLSSYMS